MKCPDPCAVERLGSQIRPAGGQLVRDADAELLGGPVTEGHGEDLVGSDSLLDEPTKPLGGGEGLARTGAGSDEERSLRSRVRGRGLFDTQDGAADTGRAHSGGAPP